MNKKNFAKLALVAGLAALGWLLDVGGTRGGSNGDGQNPAAGTNDAGRQAATVVQRETPAPVPRQAAAEEYRQTQSAPDAKAEVSRDGEYDSLDDVAAYVRKFGGRLPVNYITKAQARQLGWQGGPLEPYAPGKSIGGDHFGNYEHRLPEGRYRECDIGTRGRARGGKRLIFTTDGRTLYYTDDHYETFRKLEAN
jgi:guanyl-specific ribonuclease Sa